MKKVVMLLLLMVSPAWGADDDSTPYMPFPETPQTQQAPAKKPAPKKKAAAPKKKAPAKKTPAKKTPARPKAPARPSSLQQGIALMQQERYEQAKPYLLRAIQENRNNPNAWYWYGVYHEKIGSYHQAQYFYSKAVTIDPTFEPLSRVVFYPEDSEKTPLWDPKRPARVYPVEVASTGGISGVPAGVSRFPEAPNDPELPHVPVYTPPEPGSSPLDGDSWGPAIYVPPSPEEAMNEGEHSPLYIPPEPSAIIADNRQAATQVYYPEGYEYDYEYEAEQPVSLTHGEGLRADKPLYNPPRPGEKAPTPPKVAQQAKKQAASPAQAPAKTQSVSKTQRKASVPASRVVRKTAKKSAAPKKTQPQQRASRQPASRDVRPAPSQPAPSRTPEPVTLPPEPEPSQERQQYIPPVGQGTPDPGMIPEAPIPPVNQ